jgi:hypothetical protein
MSRASLESRFPKRRAVITGGASGLGLANCTQKEDLEAGNIGHRVDDTLCRDAGQTQEDEPDIGVVSGQNSFNEACHGLGYKGADQGRYNSGGVTGIGTT